MYVIVCVCARAQGCKHIYIIRSTSLRQHTCNLEPILSDSNPLGFGFSLSFGACYIGKQGPKKHVNKLWLPSATTGDSNGLQQASNGQGHPAAANRSLRPDQSADCSARWSWSTSSTPDQRSLRIC